MKERSAINQTQWQRVYLIWSNCCTILACLKDVIYIHSQTMLIFALCLCQKCKCVFYEWIFFSNKSSGTETPNLTDESFVSTTEILGSKMFVSNTGKGIFIYPFKSVTIKAVVSFFPKNTKATWQRAETRAT